MSQQAQQLVSVEPATVPSTMRGLLIYFLRLGTFGFGGPIALAGYMREIWWKRAGGSPTPTTLKVLPFRNSLQDRLRLSWRCISDGCERALWEPPSSGLRLFCPHF
jgi:hypothetical protein